MDITESLRNAENALRDFISYKLNEKYGSDWFLKCRIEQKTLNKWRKTKEKEINKLQGREIESRLLYFADFSDLKTILENEWEEFSEVFGEWNKMEVFFNELLKFRNAEAHGKEILPHQKHLIIGISEEIRNQIIRYRSMKEEKSSDDYYPRIERVSDSIGNVWDITKGRPFSTGCKLHIGDSLIFQIITSDPYDEELYYGLHI